MKILFCSLGFCEGATRIAQLLPEHDVVRSSAECIVDHLPTTDVIIPTMSAISADVIGRGRFGLVQQFGVGLEGVDVEAATSAGVWVARVPATGTGNAESVAEHAVLLMLSLSRRVGAARQALEEGRWGQPTGTALLGKTACLVGLGDVGMALARRLQSFGMRLIAVRRDPQRWVNQDLGIDRVFGSSELIAAVSQADYIVLCLKYDRSLRHLVDDRLLASVKPGAFLINVARGGLVDPNALRHSLEKGHLGGAGLDVFWEEPVDPSHPLFSFPNVIATPHVAGLTDASYSGIAAVVVDNVKRHAQGLAPRHAVNAPPRPRRSPVASGNNLVGWFS
jgi:phosphoglycerate dehydrogenase-like enzyme